MTTTSRALDARARFEEWARDHYASLRPETWNLNYYGDAATAAAWAVFRAYALPAGGEA